MHVQPFDVRLRELHEVIERIQLASMRVARELEIDAALRRFDDLLRLVREEDERA